MTTQLAILNKNGIAMAADSAVTFTSAYSKEQTYYTANKLFELGKGHAVAVMIYNSDSLNSVPWETIIAIYCKSLAGKAPFASLDDYAKNFIEFLRKNHKKFVPLAQQEKELQRACVDILRELDASLCGEWENLQNKNISEKEFVESQTNQLSMRQPAIPEWSDEKHFAEMFVLVKKQIDIFAGNYRFTKFIESNCLYNFIFNKIIDTSPFGWSGVVFAGIGESDMFSSIYYFNSFGYYFGRLRVEGIDSSIKITHDSEAIIVPLAQADMINSFIYGIHAEHLDIIEANKNAIPSNLMEALEENKNLYSDNIVDGISILSLGQLADVARDLFRLLIFRKQLLLGDDLVGGLVRQVSRPKIVIALPSQILHLITGRCQCY